MPWCRHVSDVRWLETHIHFVTDVLRLVLTAVSYWGAYYLFWATYSWRAHTSRLTFSLTIYLSMLYYVWLTILHIISVGPYLSVNPNPQVCVYPGRVLVLPIGDHLCQWITPTVSLSPSHLKSNAGTILNQTWKPGPDNEIFCSRKRKQGYL